MRDRVEQLDGMRGIFSILVIAHHHNAFKDSVIYNNFFVINSDLFVDFFFVLSGFVIALNYINRIDSKEDFFQFMKKRFIRLYPLLFYTEIVFLIFNLLGDFSSFKNSTDLGMAYYLNTVMDTLTLMGSTPVFGSWIGLNYPAWSISAEMISYFIFGLVLITLPRHRYIAFFILICLSVFFIISNGNYTLAYDYGFIRSTLCFCIGIFTFKLIKNKHYDLSFWEIPFLIVLVSGMYLVHEYELNLWKLVFPVLFSIGIVIFCNSSGIITAFLNTSPIQYLGRISYSIYLNHAIVLILVNVVLFRMLKSPQTEWMFAFSLLTSIALTIGYSHFTYKWIELHVGKLLRARL